MSYKLNAYQEAWLHDLETTDAPQAEGYLWIKSEGFCCLGRAAILLDPQGADTELDTVFWDFQCSILPDHLYKQLNLWSNVGDLRDTYESSDGIANSLTDFNDKLMWSFKQIAEWIRANPYQVWSDYDNS
jgi:hypothetical protein